MQVSNAAIVEQAWNNLLVVKDHEQRPDSWDSETPPAKAERRGGRASKMHDWSPRGVLGLNSGTQQLRTKERAGLPLHDL